MSIRKTQSFPNLESLSSSSPPPSNHFLPNPSNHLHSSRIPSDHLFKILDGSMLSQKLSMKLTIESISLYPNSRKLINCFLDSTLLLLDACNNIKQRLQSIRNCLDSISAGLLFLDNEPEPNKPALQAAAAALSSGRFIDKRHFAKMEKVMSRLRNLNEKLNCFDSSQKLHKAMRGSLSMAVFAIGMLSSATSIKSFDLKSNNVSMEELASTDLSSQTLLKLIAAWQKGGGSSLRRMAVKAVAGELRRRKEVVEKTLPLLEDKIEEFCQQIIAVRISMVGLLPKSCEEDCSYEESEVVKGKKGKGSIGRIRPPRCIGFVKTTSVKPHPLDL